MTAFEELLEASNKWIVWYWKNARELSRRLTINIASLLALADD